MVRCIGIASDSLILICTSDHGAIPYCGHSHEGLHGSEYIFVSTAARSAPDSSIFISQPFKKDNYEGSLSTLYAATAAEKSGRYFCPPAVDEPGSSMANDEQLAEQLMKLTVEVVTEKTQSQSVDKGCPMQTY